MRIIAGKYRGLKLNTFDCENIRPTLDRAREGIFNKIQFSIPNARCLDLFGGTGAISLEFLSRGAESVVTVDCDTRSCDLINKNFQKAKIKPNLFCVDYVKALNQLQNKRFDIIFIDPPFATDFGRQSIELISSLNLLEDDGIIVFEHSSEKELGTLMDLSKTNFSLIDSKKYGYITADFIGISEDENS